MALSWKLIWSGKFWKNYSPLGYISLRCGKFEYFEIFIHPPCAGDVSQRDFEDEAKKLNKFNIFGSKYLTEIRK